MKKMILKSVLLLLGLLQTSNSIHAQDSDGYYDVTGCKSCFPRFWGNAEYLYWKMKDAPNPVPFVISGPTGDGDIVLGDPGTSVVLGDKDIKNDWRSGGKFSIGAWFNEECHKGIEANYMFLSHHSKTQTVSSSGEPGTPTLVIPYFNVVTDEEDSTGVAILGEFGGFARLKLKNSMQGAELNAFSHLLTGCAYNVGVLGGFRYWNFDETLSFTTDTPFLVDPDIFKTKDNFSVKNNFYGGQIGAFVDYFFRNFIITAKGKVALGAMQQTVHIRGALLTNDFSPTPLPQLLSGGYFAQESNIGKRRHTEFSVVTEADINIGYDIACGFRINLGYSFLYANKVLRAGNQVDRNINPTQSSAITDTPNPELIGSAQPRPFSKDSDFWAHGLKVGLEYLF